MPVLDLLRFGIQRRRRSHQQSPRSVNGGMERSHGRGRNRVCSSPDTAIGHDDPLHPDPISARLGCVNLDHGRRASKARMRLFDYDMLADATGDFGRSRQLKRFSHQGTSSAGTMFRGALVSDEGLEIPVAIKKFHHRFTDHTSMQVYEHLKGQVLLHRNLLSPLGYSLRKGKLYVVYRYMVNGGLDQHLNTNQGLSWEQRCRIINGIAIGLHHLHSNNVIHGAVKVSNILLDQDMMTARLGDFGYSKAVSSNVLNGLKKVKLIMQRNSGLAPECIPKTIVGSTICNPTYEMDVFYFGAVILEVVCGILYTDLLVDQVWAHHQDGNIIGAVDAKLAAAGDFNKFEAQKLLLVGLACSHPEPNDRPVMEDVVEMLTRNAPLPSVPSQKPTCESALCG
ncbi:unnamed protein product [Urochloa humidicola]